MKKQEKIDLIRASIGKASILRMYFVYNSDYWYYYPNAVSDALFLGQEEYDFQLDGYHIRKLSHLKKVVVKDDLCEEINRWNGTTNGICMPDVDISSWKSAFSSLSKLDSFVIVENDMDGQFSIGLIRAVRKSGISLAAFDADGVWQKEPLFLPYSSVTHVAWGTRYDKTWYRYLKAHNRIPEA